MADNFRLSLRDLRAKWTISDPNKRADIKSEGYRPIHIEPIHLYVGSGVEALRLAEYICELHNKGV